MLSLPVAHLGQPVAPHDLWSAWNLDPVILVGLVAALALYRRGSAHRRRALDTVRGRAFHAGLGVLVVALVSPLEAMSAALASAHMVQHVLMLLIAAPLLAYAAPGSRLLAGAPLPLRRIPGRVRRGIDRRSWRWALPSNPATVFLLYVTTLWVWHSADAYDAAVGSGTIHAFEHATFIAAGFLLWRVMIGARAWNCSGGVALLLVFGAAMASVLLAVLMTFASEPWYSVYATTTTAWGLDQLSDQQLAGVLMWVPAGAIHVVIGLALFVSWVEGVERAASSAT